MQDATLTFQDLEIMTSFIDIAAQRGAIQGEEMVVIGSLRMKLTEILKNSRENIKNSDEPEDQSEEDIEATDD